MKTPILGSTYVARSVNAADNRMVNLFPEIIPEGGKEAAFLNRAPGLTLLANVGTGPIRGLHTFGGYLYVVSGQNVYKVDTSYTATLIGNFQDADLTAYTIAGSNFQITTASNTPVSMADCGSQLFIVCNGPSYVYKPSDGSFVRVISSGDFNISVGNVVYFNSYFVVNQLGTNNMFVSAHLDGTTWNMGDTASTDGTADNIVGIIVDHKEMWVFGVNTTEVWYDAGNAGFQYAPIQGAFFEIGCAAAATLAKLDNSVFWLGSDTRGQGIVYRTNGYSGERISTHAVEWQIQQYGDLSTAIAYTYQQDGHSFYVLIFPSANTTWVYDVATQSWHERCGFSNGQFTRHRGNCQTFFNNVTVIGDYQNGNIYKFDLTNYSDNGSVQKWLRSWRALPPDGNVSAWRYMPPSGNTMKRTAHHSLQLDCEAGVGLNSGQGSDPQVMLRWSDDGGHTWSNEHWVSIGAIGNYGQRAIWRRLGMTMKLRDRIYEVSGTDPVKIAILGAELTESDTNA